jgi:hypothetical protein
MTVRFIGPVLVLLFITPGRTDLIGPVATLNYLCFPVIPFIGSEIACPQRLNDMDDGRLANHGRIRHFLKQRDF